MVSTSRFTSLPWRPSSIDFPPLRARNGFGEHILRPPPAAFLLTSFRSSCRHSQEFPNTPFSPWVVDVTMTGMTPDWPTFPFPRSKLMPMQTARAPPRVDYRSLPISSSGRRPAKEAPMPLSEYEALHCLDAERFRREFDVRDGCHGLREETYANRWNHMPISRPEYDSLKVYSTTNAYPDMPYIRCREEYYYQERLCNLLESIIQASQAGSRDASSCIFPPSGQQILGAFCFPFPLDKVYWMDNFQQGFSRWRRWAVDDSRVRTSHSYFFSYHDVEFWNIAVERRREVYLRVPRTEFFNVTRDLPILNPPCVAYHTTILRRSSDPVVGAFWQVLFLE